MEWRTLSERLDAASTGHGGVVMVTGPAGSGKTRMIRAAVEAATAAGMAVTATSCDGEDSVESLGALRSSLGLLVASSPPSTLSARSGSPRSGSPRSVSARSGGLDGGGARSEERVDRGPVVVVLDDLHRADPASVLAVRRLVLPLASAPVLWLLAARLGEVGAALGRVLAALETQEGATTIELSPLSDRAVAQLVSDVTGATPDSELLSLSVGTGANPLAVLELTEGLVDEGVIEVAHGRSRLARGAQRSVEQIVRHRLERLSSGARQLVEVAAVLGRSFAVHDVASAVGVPVGRLLPAVREATAAGLLGSSDAEELTFRHELVRDAVYRGLQDPIRLALHRQIGEALLDRGGVATQAAAHLIHGARPGDRRVLAALDQAIDSAQRSFPESAADLAGRALGLTEAADPARLARTVTTVSSLIAAGRLEEAKELARSTLALGGVPAVASAQLRVALSALLFIQGSLVEAVAQAEMILTQVSLPDELYAAAEVTQLMGLVAQGDMRRARGAAVAILAGGVRPDSHAAFAAALTALAHTSWCEGRIADSLELIEAAIQRDDRGPAPGMRAHPRLLLADMLTALGDFDTAETALSVCAEEIELDGDGLWAAMPTIARSRLSLARGKLVVARAEAEAGLTASEELGAGPFARRAGRVLASIALSRGDLSGAATEIERNPKPSPSSAEALDISETWIVARLAEFRDGPMGGVTQGARLYEDRARLTRLLLEEPDAAAWLVRTALAAGDRRRAEYVVACSEHLAGDNPTFRGIGARATQARGLLDRDTPALVRSAAGHDHPWARASAAEDAGVVLAAAGQRAGARPHFETALTGYLNAGADRDAARVRARLRKVGVRHRHWVQAERPVLGWPSLTDAERAVAALVAEGLTNQHVADRLFLSRHTVDFHLRQIFRKLSIGSRVELTRLTLEAAESPGGESPAAPRRAGRGPR